MKKKFFLASLNSLKKGVGSGVGDPDPEPDPNPFVRSADLDPLQIIMDPQHCFLK
jgi:hypothetical protein